MVMDECLYICQARQNAKGIKIRESERDKERPVSIGRVYRYTALTPTNTNTIELAKQVNTKLKKKRMCLALAVTRAVKPTSGINSGTRGKIDKPIMSSSGARVYQYTPRVLS